MFTLYDAENQFRGTLTAAAGQINALLHAVLLDTDTAAIAVSLGGSIFAESCDAAKLAAERAHGLRKVALAARHGLVVATGTMTGEDEEAYRDAVGDCDLMLALMAKVRMLQDQREAFAF